jgi:hypothetical protein
VTTVGVAGLGYWGPNLDRHFDRLPGGDVTWLCDESPAALERYGRVLETLQASLPESSRAARV